MRRTPALGLVLIAAAIALPDATAESRQQLPRLIPTTPAAEQRNQAVTVEDLRILERAAELLKDESMWNRADDRECKDDEASGKRSLFCVLQKGASTCWERTIIVESRCRRCGSRSRTPRAARTSSIA